MLSEGNKAILPARAQVSRVLSAYKPSLRPRLEGWLEGAAAAVA